MTAPTCTESLLLGERIRLTNRHSYVHEPWIIGDIPPMILISNVLLEEGMMDPAFAKFDPETRILTIAAVNAFAEYQLWPYEQWEQQTVGYLLRSEFWESWKDEE